MTNDLLFLSAGSLICQQNCTLTFKGEGDTLIVTSNLTLDDQKRFAKDLSWNLTNNFEVEVRVTSEAEGKFTLTSDGINFDKVQPVIKK